MANYTLDDIEKKGADKFIEAHKKCRPHGKDPYRQTAPFSYIFTPTGIGVAVKIKCPYCGRTKDITNIDCW